MNPPMHYVADWKFDLFDRGNHAAFDGEGCSKLDGWICLVGGPEFM